MLHLCLVFNDLSSSVQVSFCLFTFWAWQLPPKWSKCISNSSVGSCLGFWCKLLLCDIRVNLGKRIHFCDSLLQHVCHILSLVYLASLLSSARVPSFLGRLMVCKSRSILDFWLKCAGWSVDGLSETCQHCQLQQVSLQTKCLVLSVSIACKEPKQNSKIHLWKRGLRFEHSIWKLSFAKHTVSDHRLLCFCESSVSLAMRINILPSLATFQSEGFLKLRRRIKWWSNLGWWGFFNCSWEKSAPAAGRDQFSNRLARKAFGFLHLHRYGRWCWNR